MASISVYGYDPEMLDNFHTLERRRIGRTLSETSTSRPLHKDSTRFPFLELPFDLRHQIYSHVMPTSLPNGIWYRATAPIWATCRIIHEECISMLYSNCIFHLDVGYESVGFPYVWINTKSAYTTRPLTHKRNLGFPGVISSRYRHLLRRISVSVTQVDEYDGMIKFNYSNPHTLASGVRKQVEKLCNFLQALPEIRELCIKYCQKKGGNPELMRLVLEPFRVLRNTRSVSVQDSGDVDKDFAMQLQARLANAYIRHSFLGLPPEVRVKVYSHLMPKHITSVVDGNEKRIWQPGDLTILRTCKLIYNEADHQLYDLTVSESVRVLT